MDDILKKYIDFCNIFYQSSFMIVLDLQLNAIFVGDGYLNVTHKTRDWIIGKNLYQTSPIPPENVEPSRKCFEKSIKNKQIVSVMLTNLLHKGVDTYFMGARIKPILNPETNNVMALEFEFYNVNWKSSMRYIMSVSIISTPKPQLTNDDFLTQREHEVGFLLFYCQNTLEIANVISKFNHKQISQKTVQNIISERLYKKLEKYNRSDLIAELQRHNYHKKIPDSLLYNQFIDLS